MTLPLPTSSLPISTMKELESRMKSGIEAGTSTNAEPLTKLSHSFIPGGYARQLWRPKGTLIVGKTHRGPCFNFLMQGQLTIWSESETKTVTAPMFWISLGGKRVTLAHEDSLLITVHSTDETDLDKIERELIAPEVNGAALPEQVKQLLGTET